MPSCHFDILLRYLYLGVVTCDRADLKPILETADYLQIRQVDKKEAAYFCVNVRFICHG